MPVFGAVFSRILPEEYIEPFMYILNLVTNKRLELPSKLLDLFENNRDVESFDPSMAELKKQYLGQTTKHDLVDTKNRFLKNKSNMMQGILHYTSSVVHCGYILLWEKYAKDRLTHDLQMHTELHIKITSKVSSDDSSVILSLLHKSAGKQQNYIIKRRVRSLLKVKENCYKYFSALQSYEKSTVACTTCIEEFNSLWYYRNTLLTPLIKFVFASIRTHPSSRLSDRFNVFSNLRNNLLENSGSIMLTSLSQLCQVVSHYRTLGSNTNTCWPEFKQLLLNKPHPAFGFF
jgi:hypothetical protein